MRIEVALQPGLVSDETSFDTPGRFRDGNNVRFYMGQPEIIGGWAAVTTSLLGGVCRNVLAWADNAGSTNIAFGTHSTLQVLVGGTIYDITPTGLSSGSIDGAGGPGYGTGTYGSGTYGTSTTPEWYARTWSLATYGEYLLANPRGSKLYVWDNDTANIATEITESPDNINCILVTPERQVLAFGCSEEISGEFNPMCIRGSDLEDYTDWTTATDNNAFEHILEGGGRIVGAQMLGSYVAVWTDTGAFLGQFIGAVGQAYRFDPVADNCGLIGPNAVTVVNQVAYWVTPDLQIYRWVLGGAPEKLPCPIHRDFADNMVQTQGEKLVAAPNGKFEEIWFHYPDARDGIENSRYIGFDTRDGSWLRGTMGRTAAIDAGPTQFPIKVTYEGVIYWHENGHSADGGALRWSLTTSDFYLMQAEQMVLLRSMWPDFQAQQGAVMITINLRDFPQSDTRTVGPYTLAAGQHRQDMLAQGRIASLTFSGASAPAFMRLGKPSFDVKATGLY